MEIKHAVFFPVRAPGVAELMRLKYALPGYLIQPRDKEEEGDERVCAAYRSEKYERLVELKKRYDQANLFHLNQNIRLQ